MKYIDMILEIRELCSKYENDGLSIYIEFNGYGMIIRGYWDRYDGLNNSVNFNRIYEYSMLKKLMDGIDIGVLVEEFKEEFDGEIKKKMNGENE